MGDFARAQAGDPDALASLTRAHMPLVQALSRRFSYCEDAFQWGCLGLVKAIRGFREEAGWQFSTYAVPWILGEMRKAFSGMLGWRTRATLRRARAFQEAALRENGREPSVLAMAQAAGTTPEELMLLLEADRAPVPYDEPDTSLTALPDPRSDRWLTRLLIRDILSRMPETEGWLLVQRFALGRSQGALARALNTSQSSVSRRETLARRHFIAQWNA